jgi:hypothetical protein
MSSAAAPRRLPPNFTVTDFEEFVKRIGPISGQENFTVVSKEFALDDGDYTKPCKAHDMHALYDREFFLSSAVVCPRNVSEVQDIMRLCNELKVPVWPYSIGRNTGYGGTAPRVPGSLGIDLGRHMNRVLEVNVEGAYALLEPGVTFQGLYDYLVENDLDKDLWIDVGIIYRVANTVHIY